MRHQRRWAALVALVLCAGCSEVIVKNRTPTGTLQIDVVDESGPVSGADLELTGPDRDRFVIRTRPNFDVRTSAQPGSWSVRITPPTTHVVPPSQPNPVSVTVARDETTVIRFNLVRAAPR
jgi:hypothetical protein